MVTSPFVPTPGYTYLQPSQRQVETWRALKGKPHAQAEYEKQMGKFLGWDKYQANVRAQWIRETLAKYPSSRYSVRFEGDQAIITPLPLAEVIQQETARLSPEQQRHLAQSQLNVLAFQKKRARERDRKKRFIPPGAKYQREAVEYRTVSRRSGTLQEYDIPLILSAPGPGRVGVASGPPGVVSTSTGDPNTAWLRGDGTYKLTRYGLLPQVESMRRMRALGYYREASTGPTDYFSQYMEANKEYFVAKQPPHKRTGEDVPLHEAVYRYLFEGGMEKGAVDWIYSVAGREPPEDYTPVTPLFGGSFTRTFGGAIKGVVREVESTVGFGEALIGAPSQRSYIHTLGGSLVGEGIGVFTGQPLGAQMSAYGESLHPDVGGAELMGELVSVYLISRGFGYVLGQVGGRVGPWVKGTRVGQAVVKKVQPVIHTVKFSRTAQALSHVSQSVKRVLPSWRGSRIDVFLAKHSRGYYRKTGGVSVGEVVLPHLAGDTPRTLGMLKAQFGASVLMEAPRTSGIGLGKYLLTAKTSHMKHLVSRGGLVTIGYLAESGFQKTPVELLAEQRSLLPLVSQHQVTRMGIVPYMGGRKASLTLPSIVSPSLRTVPLLAPSLTPEKPRRSVIQKQAVLQKEVLRSTPKHAPQRLRLRQEFQTILHQELERILPPSFEEHRQVERKRTLLRNILTPLGKTIQTPIQTPVQVQTPELLQLERQHLQPLLRQEQKQKLQPPGLFHVPSLRVPPFWIPGFFRVGGGRDLGLPGPRSRGKWFKRTHAIKGAREVWSDFWGEDRRRSRRKRRSKR